jgi:type I restriction enzyme R subunit
VDDKATVPLFYENRIPEVQLSNENLNEDMQDIIEGAMLDEDEEKKLERELGREYHIITRDDRLEKIAEDIVDHYVNRGFQGKAIVISIDKPTTVKMYDKVEKYWKKYLDNLKKEVKEVSDWEKSDLEEKIKLMENLDRAVVVSQEQNEIKKFEEKGLDFKKHRERLVKEDLAKKFQDPEDDFKLAFVCNMWLTGFDVPSLSTIYLDKPMRNHTLMQTIARANRVFEDKSNGLIVDYAGIFKNLQKALSIYSIGKGEGSESPIQDKKALLKNLKESREEVFEFLRSKEVNPDKISQAESLEKIKLIQDAVDKLVKTEEEKKKFLAMANNFIKLYKSILPDKDAKEFNDEYLMIKVLAQKIRSLAEKPDISGLMNDIEKLLDESIEADSYVIYDPLEKVDLSEIDFEKLKEKFKKQQKHATAEKLKGKINSKINKMVKLNPTRVDYMEKFQEMIEEYNSGKIDIDLFFSKLVALANDLNEEEKRHAEENMTEEELAVFDLIKKDNLPDKEKEKVKKMAKEVLKKLKNGKLVLDYKKKQQTRAIVYVTIKNTLFGGLPESYDEKSCSRVTDNVYRHIYDSYAGEGVSVYEEVKK